MRSRFLKIAAFFSSALGERVKVLPVVDGQEPVPDFDQQVDKLAETVAEEMALRKVRVAEMPELEGIVFNRREGYLPEYEDLPSENARFARPLEICRKNKKKPVVTGFCWCGYQDSNLGPRPYQGWVQGRLKPLGILGGNPLRCRLWVSKFYRQKRTPPNLLQDVDLVSEELRRKVCVALGDPLVGVAGQLHHHSRLYAGRDKGRDELVPSPVPGDAVQPGRSDGRRLFRFHS